MDCDIIETASDSVDKDLAFVANLTANENANFHTKEQASNIETIDNLAEDDDDFGDFEESTSVQPQPTESLESLVSLYSNIHKLLEESVDDQDCSITGMDLDESTLFSLLDQPSTSSKTFKIWDSLRIIEESVALKFTFGESLVYKMYFDSLGLDMNLAKLSKCNVPRFAMHFNPLETLMPEKLTEKIVENGRLPNLKHKIDDDKKDLSTKSVARLDMEFFSTINDMTCQIPQMFKSETSRATESPSEPVNVLTSLAAATTTKITNVSTVQAEALKIAGKLPDLSFMLSPVLMFPLKDNYSADGSDVNRKF